MPWALVAILLALAAVVWALGRLVGLFPDLGNPFGEETVDRSRPALLKSIRDIGQYRAASGHFEVLVGVEKDTRLVPSVIRGERVLFVAVGQVDAGVDLRGIGADAVRMDEERTAVDADAAAGALLRRHRRPGKSYVYDRDRGAVDRIASLFHERPDERARPLRPRRGEAPGGGPAGLGPPPPRRAEHAHDADRAAARARLRARHRALRRPEDGSLSRRRRRNAPPPESSLPRRGGPQSAKRVTARPRVRRLRQHGPRAAALKEGAHGGTRGFPCA